MTWKGEASFPTRAKRPNYPTRSTAASMSGLGVTMGLSRIRRETVALFVAAALILLVGTVTGNAGFVVAGLIVAVVAVIVGFNQSQSKDDSRGGEPK